MSLAVRFDPDLVRRYDCHGPRYTSYPTALQFHPRFDAEAYRCAAAASRGDPPRPLSLYVHVPFCASPCFYCGCNRVITRSPEKAERYLGWLGREIAMQGELFGRSRPVEQLHLGGGTPTFLSMPQLAGLMQQLVRHFGVDARREREYSLEIDPRTVRPEALAELAALGFNRLSLGVQDFDPEVQRAVNRIQSAAETLHLIGRARAAGFESIGVDLIYGLPLQTPARFARTLDAVIAARPDRLAVYAYAHMPQLFKAQRRIRAEQLPSAETRLALLGLTIEMLTAAGYVFIGMDHFALPGDELVRAQTERTLQRNFQGYSTRAHCDLVGLGVSAIGRVGAAYVQNCKSLPEYAAAIEAGSLPVQRGLVLDAADRLRGAVIQEIMCHGRVDRDAIGRRFGVDFDACFAAELQRLHALEADGLVRLAGREILVTSAGRLLLRHVAMVFDAYLSRPAAAQAFSKAI